MIVNAVTKCPVSKLRVVGYLPWQRLNFLPEPHGHCSLRPTFGIAAVTTGAGCPESRELASIARVSCGIRHRFILSLNRLPA